MTEETAEKRMYLNGKRWWLRMRDPAGGYTRRSTGTEHVKLANRIARMTESLYDERSHRDLYSAALVGTVTLPELYDAYAAGNMDRLRTDLERKAVLDPDIEPFVDAWHNLDLKVRTLTEQSRLNYVRQVRALIPEGIPYPCSKFSEDNVKKVLMALDVTDSTRRRYLAAWQLFCRFLRRRLPGVSDPFEHVKEWAPDNAGARSNFWTHGQVLNVLNRMHGDARRAMALTFGSGMELGALLAMTHGDVLGDRMVIAHGTKNEHRRDRTIFVDRWAHDIFMSGLNMLATTEAPLFSISEAELRKQFYTAQVEAGFIKEPELSPNGKKLWHSVNPHTIHDARHTFAITRMLGLDGEPKRTMKFVSLQLGHASEQMLQQVYARVNGENRLAVMQAEIAQDLQNDHKEKLTLSV